MLSSLGNDQFFSEEEIARLSTLGLWQAPREPLRSPAPAKIAFAGLLLAPIMEIVVHDNATTSAEFESVAKYIRTIEREFALGSREKIESIGTEMGLLPMVAGTWSKQQFSEARSILAQVLNRMPEADSNPVRTAITRATLAVALAGSSHLISIHALDREEREMIRELIQELELDKCAEGMQLLDTTTEA